MGLFSDIIGTSSTRFQVGKNGYKVETVTAGSYGGVHFMAPNVPAFNPSVGGGEVDIYSADVKLKADARIQFNYNSTDTGGSWQMNLLRPNSGMTAAVNYTLPPAPIDGYFLQTNASGVLSWQPTSGITWSTQVNANIIPDGQSTRNIGGSGSEFNTVFTNEVYGIGGCGTVSIHVSNGQLFDDQGVISVDWQNHNMKNNAGTNVIDYYGVTTIFGAAKIRLPKSASDPSSPTSGDAYYNTTSNKIKFYNGSGWETVTSA